MAGWLAGFGCSVLADQVFFLSLTWAALQVGSPSEVGVVLAAGSVPRLVILLVGGAVADQASPKRIIIGTDTGRAIVMAAAAIVLMAGSMNIVGLIVVAVVIGALDGLFLPAVGTLPARIAPAHLMGRVAALRTVTQRLAMLVGGPLAGWLIYLSGPTAAFWGSAALFAVSVGSLSMVTLNTHSTSRSATRTGNATYPPAAARPDPDATQPRPAPAHPSPRSSGETSNDGGGGFFSRIRDGLLPVRHDPVLPWLLVLVAGMNLGFAGPVTAGLPLLAAVSQWGAPGAGLLLGGFGLGAAVSGLGLVFVRGIPRAGWVALTSVFTMGVTLAAVGTLHTLTMALAATVVLGLASGVFGTVVHAIILTSTPRAELGRVMGVLCLSVEGVVPISYAATGLLTAALGVHVTILIGGLVIVATTTLASTRPALRSLQLRQPGQPANSHPAPATTAATSPAHEEVPC